MILKLLGNEVIVRVNNLNSLTVIKQAGHHMHMNSDLNPFGNVTTHVGFRCR